MANALAAVISVTRFYYVRIASRAGNTRRAGADPKEPRKIRRANNGLSCVSLSRNGRPVSDYCTRCARHDALRRLRGSLRREFSVSECYIIAAGRIETSRKFHALNPPGARDRESHASQPRRVFVLSHFPVFFSPLLFLVFLLRAVKIMRANCFIAHCNATFALFGLNASKHRLPSKFDFIAY